MVTPSRAGVPDAVLVTGSSGLIGSAAVRRFAQSDWGIQVHGWGVRASPGPVGRLPGITGGFVSSVAYEAIP